MGKKESKSFGPFTRIPFCSIIYKIPKTDRREALCLKKRIAAAVLAVLLVISVLPPPGGAEATPYVCFLAVNDTLLDLSNMPYTQGGTTYVPYWIFKNFRIYYSFFSGNSTATLYTSERQLYFNMADGKTYDGSDNPYSISAVYRGGVVYVPVGFVCAFFGIRWSPIQGNEYGDIVRIRDGSEVLSDSQFLSAAASLMQSRYTAYVNASSGQTGSNPPTPSGGNGEHPEIDKSNTAVSLSFQGMPTPGMLDTLASFHVSACFFVTPQEIRSFPDMLRQLLGGGHSVGVLCGEDPEGDCREASALLFEAAMHKTLLVAAPPGLEEPVSEKAAELSLVYRTYDIGGYRNEEPISSAADITSVLELSEGRVSMRLVSGDETESILPAILQYLQESKFRLTRAGRNRLRRFIAWKKPVKAVVLAAGRGTRLRSAGSDIPKVMRLAAGRPLLYHVLKALSFLPPEDIVVVVGYKKAQVVSAFPGYAFADQTEQLGTGHAVASAGEQLTGFQGDLLICCGDMPLLRRESFEALLHEHRAANSACSILSGTSEEPLPYGRVIRDENGRFFRHCGGKGLHAGAAHRERAECRASMSSTPRPFFPSSAVSAD